MENERRVENLKWLRTSNPSLSASGAAKAPGGHLQISLAKNGQPTLRADNNQIHSAYDPATEAERQAQKALEAIPAGNGIVLFGLGLGYLARALGERQPGPMIVIEADPAVLDAAIDHGFLAGLGETQIYAGNRVEDALIAIKAIADRVGGWLKLSFIHHPPSVKRFTSFYEEIEALAKARESQVTSPLGILVVTPMGRGSLPIAYYCANAFRRLGHRVEMLDNSIYEAASRQIETVSRDRNHRGALGNLLTTLMAETITARALDRAVDLVWLVAQSPITASVAAELKKRRIPTAYWFVEEWQLYTYWREFAPRFDYFFTIQGGRFPEALDRIGITKTKVIPLAADPEIHRPLILSKQERSEFGSDVSHVGAGYRNRRQTFSGLAGFDFKLWGSDWDDPGVLHRHLQRDGARISTEDSVKIFNATKVNLNLHSSQFHDGVNPEGDYLNPRTFEIAASGAFQLVDRRSDLPTSFEPGKEIAVFEDARELPPLIQHYLDHPDERKRITEAGRRRVLADHTYDLRMKDVLEYIYSREPVRASTRHPNHVENLMKEAAGDADMLSLLAELKDQGVVTLDDIVERIRKRDGDLTPAEMIFLLMFEFRRWAAEKGLV